LFYGDDLSTYLTPFRSVTGSIALSVIPADVFTPAIVFFYCFGDHHDLHSFPTRRSSDLAPSDDDGVDAVRRGALHVVAAVTHHQDRKSTRLNSSHVKISYAVFGLKKKNRGGAENWVGYGGHGGAVSVAGVVRSRVAGDRP